MLKSWWLRLLLLALLLAGLGTFAYKGLYAGWFRLNYPSWTRYPIQGLDVSAHQGEIHWDKIKNGPYSFVFIKATEGGDFKDIRFKENWAGARKAGLTPGAYHFFTFCTPGKMQADNFRAMVKREPLTLPPVVDLEFGGNCSKRLKPNELAAQLGIFLHQIQFYYKQKPILYVTQTFADVYLSQDLFKDYPLWYRNIYYEPGKVHGREWQFWQYANRAHVEGIKGFVDLNVFKGSREDFISYISKSEPLFKEQD